MLLNYMTWPSSAYLPYSLHLAHSLPFRLALNNDWLLEEGWSLYLVKDGFVLSPESCNDLSLARVSFHKMRR
jgi:hypothetical protein